ncbi:N-methyl-L-tryptophan oxidase [Paenibacillus shunpengii]|uniref:N-methyl-L-tryptophan oxidase n=1 Tax=Paenibacillus shunpengii TaxID=2054424 RepID=A0ABW5SL22_9BACL|nr:MULTISPECIES: N-methyl-L-tryptophan oxidase [unclassified Paenibacillus]SDW18790.1 N-methyl-L-tryptophan oxidase [Paenibacillus sp. PDC88]
MKNKVDVIIIGAGTMGLSSGYYLAKSGKSVLMLDAYEPPHTQGSHHGDTRLFRYAYTGDLVYNAMAVRAHELWSQLERESSSTLLIPSGVLNISPDHDPLAEEKWNNALAFNLSVERLSTMGIKHRWPGFHLPKGYSGILERRAGYLLTEPVLHAYKGLAERHGARLVTGAKVLHWESSGSGYIVHTAAEKYEADQLVITTGAWASETAESVKPPVAAVRQVIGWFEAPELFDVSQFPGFTLDTENGLYYGFPSKDGSGLKIGRHDWGTDIDPSAPLLPFQSGGEDEEILRQALHKYIPEANGRLIRGAACKYENTPDEDFIIDYHPDHKGVVLACGFSGHGFKFASAVGELISNLVNGDSIRYNLSAFRLDRFQHLQDHEATT